MPLRQRYQYDSVEGARFGRFNAGINTTFIVYRIGSTVIDTGPANQWRSVRRFLAEQPVEQLLITHHHEDHSGNGAVISREYGLIPFAPKLAQAKLASGYVTPLVQRLVWGSPRPVETRPLPASVKLSDGSPLIPVHTPGHAKDLTCFFLPQQKWFFSGDLYISKMLKLLRIDEDFPMLMDSIGKVLALDFDVLFCPHRGIVEDGKASLQAKFDNLLELSVEVQALRDKGLTPREISDRMLGVEGWLTKLSRYNISRINLIEGALKLDLGRPVTSRVVLPEY